MSLRQFKQDVDIGILITYITILTNLIQTPTNFRANLIHLSRMKTDCKYMEKLIHDLEESYEEEMIKKFGMKVDLDELEEGILRKMVYDIRATTVDIQKEYNTKARELRTEFAKRQEELKCVVMKEIEKLNILTVLQEEYNLLNGLLMQQSGQDVVEIDNTMWEEDLARLTSVANQQKLEIQVCTLVVFLNINKRIFVF